MLQENNGGGKKKKRERALGEGKWLDMKMDCRIDGDG